jgi:hypothetical protein
MRWMIVAACLATGILCMPAAAQVHRCQDSAGKTIYTDAPCAAGQKGVMIERARSREEILQDRMQAAEAMERKYREREAERDRQLQDSTRQAATSPSASVDKSSSFECRQAQRDHETVSSIRTGTEEERRNRINSSTQAVNSACGLQTEMIQPPPKIVVVPRPSRIVNCNSGVCYDDRGGVYQRNGRDFMTGPGGRTCNRTGTGWNCH